MIIPEIPPKLRQTLDQMLPGFYNWWQDFKNRYLLQGFTTTNDITVSLKGKGIVLTNAAGTVTKRVRLNDAGNGLIYEDV